MKDICFTGVLEIFKTQSACITDYGCGNAGACSAFLYKFLEQPS